MNTVKQRIWELFEEGGRACAMPRSEGEPRLEAAAIELLEILDREFPNGDVLDGHRAN